MLRLAKPFSETGGGARPPNGHRTVSTLRATFVRGAVTQREL
jgi:hypothetical protein